MVQTDRFFSDKIFAKFTLGIKNVWKFIVEGINGSIINISSFFFTCMYRIIAFVREKLVRCNHSYLKHALVLVNFSFRHSRASLLHTFLRHWRHFLAIFPFDNTMIFYPIQWKCHLPDDNWKKLGNCQNKHRYFLSFYKFRYPGANQFHFCKNGFGLHLSILGPKKNARFAIRRWK